MKSFLWFCIIFACIAVSLQGQTTEIHYLSGTGSDDTVDWEFYCSAGMNSGKWAQIPVPSNWELQGFGTYNYGHDMPKANETGQYRHNFQVPTEWQGKRIVIVFEGVMTDTEVKVNGKSAGPVHQGGYYEFSYDITDLLKYGAENLLEVTVHKVSADNSIEIAERKADFWVFGGIFRPVKLQVYPSEYIQRIAVDARADGKFLVDVYPGNIKNADRIMVQVFGPDGMPLSKALSSNIKTGQEFVTLSTIYPGNMPLWTVETPELCEVLVKLQQDGETIHVHREKIGFRTVEVKPGDGIYINGKRVMMKGVNRHTMWPESGRTSNKGQSIADVQLMKDMNMNAVRMSHYPPDSHFLDVCDSLGMYVIDELTGWQKPAYDTEIGKKLVKELVVRDVNHPAVIFWANGNEGGNNHELVGEYPLYDPQNRRVIHPWDNFGGIETDHYESYDITKRYLQKHIYMPTEFLHGLYDGGQGAGLEDMWRLMTESPRGGGMFLWNFSDDGVVRSDKDGMIDVDLNHGPDGILGPHREKSGSYYAIKDIWSPVQIQLPDRITSPNFTARAANRFNFTNLDQCRLEFQLMNFPEPLPEEREKKTNRKVVTGQGTISNIELEPQANGEFIITLPDDALESDAMLLSAYDKNDRQLWTWSKRLKSHLQTRKEIVSNKPQVVNVLEDDSKVTMASGSLSMTFDKHNGRIIEIKRKRRSFPFNNGPRIVGGKDRHPHLTHYKTNDGHAVEVTSRSSNMEKIKWVMRDDGWVELQYNMYLEGPMDFIGVTFDFPKEKMRGMQWLGEGPTRVWKNRMKGTNLNVWSTPYKNNKPGTTWDWPQFKGYYADVNWVKFDTDDGPLTVVTDMPDMFLRVYTPEKAGGDLDRHTAPPFPSGDISFLHAIPGIGTKFQAAERLGPQGAQTMANGEYFGTLYFMFGEQ
jgi:hypothetical protein